MNLAELTEVLEGVRKAQAKEGGENVAAALSKTDDKGLLVHDENLGTFTVVDFDVSVVAEAKGGAKGGLKVWSVGIEGNGGYTHQQSSRIRFSVPIRIPDGDQKKLAELVEKTKQARQRASERRANRPNSWLTR